MTAMTTPTKSEPRPPCRGAAVAFVIAASACADRSPPPAWPDPPPPTMAKPLPEPEPEADVEPRGSEEASAAENSEPEG